MMVPAQLLSNVNLVLGRAQRVRFMDQISAIIRAAKARVRARDGIDVDVTGTATEFGLGVAAEVLAHVHPGLTGDEIDWLAKEADRKICAAALYLKAQGYSGKAVRTYRDTCHAAYGRRLSRWEKELRIGVVGQAHDRPRETSFSDTAG